LPIKFTPKKGEITISIQVSQHKKMVSLPIKDKGKGISQEHIPLIFDRYFMIFVIENNIGKGVPSRNTSTG
jgi:signal transduction histidine kinase